MTDNNAWAQLVCISEEDGLIIPITSDVFSVGRAKACDLSMPDNKFISGRHCNLFRRNNTVWLEDTSTNGTWLNGVKIGKGQKQRLFHKDEIAVVQQQGNQGAKDIVYRYEDCAMLEAEQERLDQTQEMADPDENTEDYVYEDVNKEEEESRKRKKIDDPDDSDEPAAKKLGEGEQEVDKKEENIGSEGKPGGDARDSVVDDNVKLTPDLKSIKDDAAKIGKNETGGKGDGDAEEGEKKEKEKTDGTEDGEAEKKMKEEGTKSAQEEETDDILDSLICSICHDILHRCISLQPCMHSFCAGCISGWMKHSKRCPQCRKHVKRVGHNYIVNSLVDAYLKQHPDKQRSKEDLEEMDARSNVPTNMTLDYNPLDDDDEEGDYDPSENEEEEEEEEEEPYVLPPYNPPPPRQPSACRQCPHYVKPLNRDAVMAIQSSLDASSSGATTSGNEASTSSGDGASSSTSSSPTKRVRLAVGGVPVPMPTPPQFQCNLDNVQHVACSCCIEIMPNRQAAPDIPPQRCHVCQRIYCHMYWGCRQYNCLGCLNRFKEMKFSESILDTIVNNNRYESKIFKDFMISRGFHNVHLVLEEVLHGLDAKDFSTPGLDLLLDRCKYTTLTEKDILTLICLDQRNAKGGKDQEAQQRSLPGSAPGSETATGHGPALVPGPRTDPDSNSESPVHPNMQCGPPRNPASCDNFLCTEEVWAACPKCWCFLCFEHFTLSDNCLSHNIAFNVANAFSEIPLPMTSSLCTTNYQGMTSTDTVEERSDCEDRVMLEGGGGLEDQVMTSMEADGENFENQVSKEVRKEEDADQVQISMESNRSEETDVSHTCIPENLEEASLPRESAEHLQLSPESFQVDGERALEVPRQQVVIKSKNRLVKEKRNAGYSYESEKSKKLLPGRRFADYETLCEKCHSRGLSCNTLSREDREAIRSSFYDLGVLAEQREWIGRHTDQIQEEEPKKLRKFAYFLPNSKDPFHKVPVCRAMFLATLGISERQVKTVFAKKQPCGIIEGERRGGRKTAERDARLREGVKLHIDEFPRQESHYCRATSRCEYLSEDLNPEIMYRMYQSTTDKCASLSLYRKVLNEMKIKFHRPKKDMCSLCETYKRGNPNEREEIAEVYKTHIAEKEKVREMKSIAKDRASVDPLFVSAVFDLEQVIYLPKSPQSEIFYKRRLSNYNFTIYELASRDGWCFLSHECETKRGSCEVASHVHRYLRSLDERGVKQVEFYCDGCVGQNKNSIIPTMLQHFIEKAKSVESVTVNYFPTNHGQSEGDSMHSVIERNVRRIKEVMVPAQLTTICKMARLHPRPYHVVEVRSRDIIDWKSAGQQKGILRVRTSEGGQAVDWKKFMALKIVKGEVNSIYFKYSHTEAEFDFIRTDQLRRSREDVSEVTPQPLYQNGPPKMSSGKYQDLQDLCSGTTPVVWHPDHQAFYKLLPH